ncbi:FecR family protein [Pedobacter sp. GR22-6]|uniref:FecR family protein n=1 Tax=Pedobacter sp. GR22-6 TaxID=3127957 RepID=UPI00307F08B6
MGTSQQRLFIKYLNDQCSNAEIVELLGHFRLQENEAALKDAILLELKQEIISELQYKDVDQRLNHIQGQLQQHIQQNRSVALKETLKLWPRIGIAAAVFLMVFSGLWFFRDKISDTKVTEIRYAGDAAPGRVGATLTLANGKQIHLDSAVNGKLASESGVSISKTADGQLVYEISGNSKENSINTLSTGRGEIYQLKLPDGSRVWLNAASRLTYSASLNEKGLRKVKLTGEAYFEIAKDPEHPFIVESAGQELRVLGTHFNVKAYQDESAVKTTLLEGSVRLSTTSIAPQASFILRPGEQAINSGHIQIENANLEEAIAWKNGNTQFKDKSLESVMLELSRWYDVKVVYAADAPRDEPFSGVVSRSRNLSAVLERMQTTGSVKFAISGKTVTVMK